jgi:hypothetical protein
MPRRDSGIGKIDDGSFRLSRAKSCLTETGQAAPRDTQFVR